jgi:hypothetical protein
VNTVLLVTRGKDGKLYRPSQLSEPELRRVRGLAHALVHRDGLSVRAAQRVMLESYGVRRSIGAISQDLTRWSCGDKCPTPPAPPADPGPPPPAAQPAASVHSTGGQLAGMVRS